MRRLSGALILAALLAGCGEGRKPEDVAKAYVGSNAASKCDVLAPALVEQLTGLKGQAALAACRRNVVRFPVPEDVRLREEPGGAESESEREREQATDAEVELIVDGHEAAVKLHKEAGTWRIVQLGE